MTYMYLYPKGGSRLHVVRSKVRRSRSAVGRASPPAPTATVSIPSSSLVASAHCHSLIVCQKKPKSMKLRIPARCNRYCKNKRHRTNLLRVPFTLSRSDYSFPCAHCNCLRPPSPPAPLYYIAGHSKVNVIAHQTPTDKFLLQKRFVKGLSPCRRSIASCHSLRPPSPPVPLHPRTFKNECHCTPNPNHQRTRTNAFYKSLL